MCFQDSEYHLGLFKNKGKEPVFYQQSEDIFKGALLSPFPTELF